MTGQAKQNRCFVEHWETIAVTALPPGYRNVFDGGEDGQMYSPCPALLLQELRETVEAWDEESGGGKFRQLSKTHRETPPYMTRVVFADTDGDSLEPASDCANYTRTLAPGEELDDGFEKVLSLARHQGGGA